MYSKNLIPFGSNEVKNCCFKFFDLFYVSNFVVEFTPFLNAIWKNGKNEFSNTLVLAGTGLILFCVVERVQYSPPVTALW